MLGIGEDLAELAPDALLLNYTNPMAMLCEAYFKGSPHKRIVGLCHSVQHTTRQLSEYVGVPFEEVTFLGAGVNHQSWILRFEHEGRDLYPALDAAIAASPELQRHVRVELYKRFGRFPTESSEHSAEYLPWLMRDDAALERLRIPVDEYVRRSEENLVEFERTKDVLAAGGDFELERSLEYASLIIHSMVTGQERTIYGNVRNDGLIENLPDGVCVEVPCLVDRAGVQPTRVGRLPVQLAALEPDVPRAGRADRGGGARGVACARVPSGDARSERCRQPVARDDHDDLRRAAGGARRHASSRPVSELLVAGDVNPDLVLSGGDVEPRFGQTENIVESGPADDRRLGGDHRVRGGATGRRRGARRRGG